MDTTTIKEQFNRIAGEYDAQRRSFIPCYDAFYDGATDFLAAVMPEPKHILDLGSGTGILAAFWYEHFPNAQYLLADTAEDMLDVARKRFEGLENVRFAELDYSEGLPDGDFDLVVSALSIHHLTDPAKQTLFSQLKDRLPDGGIFANYDQFCGTTPLMTKWMDEYWQDYLTSGGLTAEDIRLWRQRRRLDRECSLEAEESMLKQSGFDSVQCIFSSGKFSVICAVA